MNQLLNDGDWFKRVWNAGQCHRIDAGSHGAEYAECKLGKLPAENFADKNAPGSLAFSCVSADRKRRTVFVFLNQTICTMFWFLRLTTGAKGHNGVIGQANQVYNDMLRECITDLLEGNDGGWQ